MLKYTTERTVSVQNWDALVTETYGRPYSLQQQDGCMQRGVVRLEVPAEATDHKASSIPEEINGEQQGVNFAAWQARDPATPVGNRARPWEIEMFWHSNFYPDLQTVANDLHARGLVEAGSYLIDIDW